MRFGETIVHNFHRFADERFRWSDVNHASVSGDNGAGKSSLFVDAPLFCLFGQLHEPLDDAVGPFGDTCSVSQEVDMVEETLRVTRGRKRGSTSSLLIERMDFASQEWQPVCSGVKEGQAFIDEHILHGRGYRELVASTFMVQSGPRKGQQPTFTSATQSEAKDIFIRMLAADRWLERGAKVSRMRKTAEQELSSYEAQLDALPVYDRAGDARIVELTDLTNAKRPELEKLREEAATLKARLDEADKVNDSIRFLHDELEGIDMRIAQNNADAQEILASLKGQTEDEDTDAMREHVEALREAENAYRMYHSAKGQRQTNLDRYKAQRNTAVEYLSDAEDKLATYDHDVPTCIECGQEIRDEKALAKAKAEREAQVDKARLALRTIDATIASDEKALADMGPEPEYTEGALARAELAYNNALSRKTARVAYRAKLERADELDHERAAAKKRLDEAPEPVDVEQLTVEYNATVQYGRDLRIELDTYEDELRRLELVRDMAKEADAKRTTLSAKVATLTERLEVLRLAERAFGRDGIPAYLMDASLPMVEDITNEILSLMSGDTLSVRLSTQGATKKGEARDTLDILVSDGVCERPFRTFSGGEGFRINFPLRVALAEVVARRSGLDLSMLVIDEPEGLDAPGRAMFIQALGVIAPRFESVVLISHHEDLKEALPQQVVVRSGSAGSTVSIHG